MKFSTFYTQHKTYKGNYANHFQKRYKVLKPYQKNKETGEILNKTEYTIFKEIEPENINDLIQSYREDADLITKLKRGTAQTIPTPKLEDLQFGDTTKSGTIHDEYEKKILINNIKNQHRKKVEEIKKQQQQKQEPKPENTKQPEPTKETKTNE